MGKILTTKAENYGINLGQNIMIQTIVPENDKQANLQFEIQVIWKWTSYNFKAYD